jgi:3-oxoacyl-[acyl-carrier protein] reductase
MKKIALVTGSSRGIGKAIAFRFAKEGYHIILHGFSKSRELQDTEKKIKEIGIKTSMVFFDVSNKIEVETSCKNLLKKVGTVDVLINNAGISRDNKLINMPDRDWDDVIRTNLYGPFYLIKQFLPTMQERNFGRIINISSIAAKGAYGKTNYAAAKAGLIGMTKSLALEVGKYNITVNAICPGYIETSLSAKIPLKYQKQFLSEIALKRIGTPEEVANMVVYLANNESSYITGAVIDIDGGWL